MKILLEEGTLDLPQDFAFEIEHHHPFYSNAGTASIPVTLPASDANMAILGYPDRINRAQRLIRELPAIIEAGFFRKKCTLLIESAGPEGISASLALQDSEMYVADQDKLLKDIFATRTYQMSKMNAASPYSIYTGEYIDGWFLHDVALFPVACDADPESGSVFVINEPGEDSIIDSDRTLDIGDSTVTVPAGYGVAPYLYLWALVQYTFEDLGYTVRTNDIKSTPTLNNLVILHDFADVCCSVPYDLSFLWSFHYSDLVPDITVGGLISWLHDKFGIIITHDSGVIDILAFCARTESAVPTVDLSSYLIGEPNILYPPNQRLQLNVGTSIDRAAPAADSLEDLREHYENCAHVNKVDEINGTGLFLVDTIDTYYYADSNGKVSLLGSAAFPYMRRGEGEIVELSPSDQYVPMVQINDIFMPYIGKRAHKYITAGDTNSAQQIKICYAYFSSGHFQGSVTCYDEAGSIMLCHGSATNPGMNPYPSLTPEGLKPEHWNFHEILLLNSAPTLTAEFNIPVQVLLTADLTLPILLLGTRVLIKDLTYNITDNNLFHAKANLQMLSSFIDQQTAPSIDFGISYGWKVENTREIYDGNGYTIIETDNLTDYTENDAPLYKPSSAGIIANSRNRWLKYEYKKKVKYWYGAAVTNYTGTHTWKEYFTSCPIE